MNQYVYVVREKYSLFSQFHTNLLRVFGSRSRAERACRAYRSEETNTEVTIWMEAYEARTGYFAHEIEVEKL
jgi:hypothetical protein